MTAAATSLYDVLGIVPTATADEARRAYHRKALLYHPDKNPGQEAELLKVQKAYDVLNNAASRRIYDKYGELGVATLDMVKSPLLVDVLLNTARLRAIYVAVYICLVFVACFPFLLALKVQGRLHWPWLAVFAPLNLFGIMVLALGGSLLFVSWKAIGAQQDGSDLGDPDEPSPETVNSSAFFVALGILGLLTGSVLYTTILWALRLDGIIRPSYWIIGAAYLGLESVHALWVLLSLAVAKMHWSSARDGLLSPFQRAFKHPFLYLAYLVLRWSVLRVSLVALLIFKCSSYAIPSSWTAVFLPVYLILPSALVIDYFVDRGDTILALEAYDAEHGPPPTLMFKIKFVLYSLLVGLVLVSTGLLNVRLASGAPGWGVVFAPVYLVASLVLLVVVIGGLLLYRLIPDFSAGGAGAGQSGEDLTEIIVDGRSPASIIIASELEWLRRFGYILGPFQRRIRTN